MLDYLTNITLHAQKPYSVFTLKGTTVCLACLSAITGCPVTGGQNPQKLITSPRNVTKQQWHWDAELLNRHNAACVTAVETKYLLSASSLLWKTQVADESFYPWCLDVLYWRTKAVKLLKIRRNTDNMSMNVAKRQQVIGTGVKLHRANFRVGFRFARLSTRQKIVYYLI